jgi:hypothetical protein
VLPLHSCHVPLTMPCSSSSCFFMYNWQSLNVE